MNFRLSRLSGATHSVPPGDLTGHRSSFIRSAGFTQYFLTFVKFIHVITTSFPILALLYFQGRLGEVSPAEIVGFIVFYGFLTILIFKAMGVYSDEIFSNLYRFKITFYGCIWLFSLMFFVHQWLNTFPLIDTKTLVTSFMISFVLFGAERILMLSLFRHWMGKGLFLKRTVILGYTDSGKHFADHQQRNMDIRSGIIGYIDDRSDRLEILERDLPLLGNTNHLESLVRQGAIDQILVALPWLAEGRIGAIVDHLRHLPVQVLLVPDMAAFKHSHRRVKDVSGVPMFNVSELPLNGWSPLVKRCEDLILGSLAIILLSPIMLSTAIAIKLDSKGPIFFLQKRYGYNNKLIWVYKFRSMYTERADADAEVQTIRNDDRITKVGRFIRKSSIDELPQLFNVILGNMSMVGPRPHATATRAAGIPFEDAVREYSSRHRVKPGITGWAQIKGYRGETDTLHKIEKRVEYDLDYISNWSVWFDLYILFRTLPAVLSTKDVY